MTPFMKFIMHGLAAGQIPSSPQVMKTLKKLQHDQELSPTESGLAATSRKPWLQGNVSTETEQHVRPK